ncbi:hypothetical protein HNY73_004342 [Argiope bruennichi]|uniref:Uncharacterized protein n=1 Tax=Argiope bruennichi TaxID=94029 RepID=A0A8T0FPL9_ARGBR|nr:hypothetical protein HNY73_004342 [Argiope bruennichi]
MTAFHKDGRASTTTKHSNKRKKMKWEKKIGVDPPHTEEKGKMKNSFPLENSVNSSSITILAQGWMANTAGGHHTAGGILPDPDWGAMTVMVRLR